MKKIKITEVGFEAGNRYYTMMAHIDKNKIAELYISGLDGFFRLTPSQRIKLANFLLDGLEEGR